MCHEWAVSRILRYARFYSVRSSSYSSTAGSRSGLRRCSRRESGKLGRGWSNRRCTVRWCNLKTVSVTRNVGWATWPEGFDLSKPEVDLSAEEAVAAVLVGSQLIDETAVGE